MKIPLLLAPIAALGCATCCLAADAHPMRSLFNGKDLSGWVGKGYVVEDGVIVCTPEGQNLATADTFSNYILEFDFKLPPGGNNGLGIHYPGTGDGAYTGMEIQILDNSDPKYKELKDYQFNGSLYTLAPAKKSGLKPVGEWNHERVTLSGPAVTVELNGEIILRENLDDLGLRHPAHEGVKRRAGQIAFLGHGDRVAFRNIQIAETPPPANIEGVKAAGFSRLFNGKNLSGWKPANIPKWTATNGILRHANDPGDAADLWTEKEYGNYTIVFDWRWSGCLASPPTPLEGGIYLRGKSFAQKVNLWTNDDGSGGVYDRSENPGITPEMRALMTPKVKADRPAGEWNRTMATIKGDRLTVSLNGRVVLDNVQLQGSPPKGPIGLQDDHAPMDFANLWIKEL